VDRREDYRKRLLEIEWKLLDTKQTLDECCEDFMPTEPLSSLVVCPTAG
jgi:hypothetical protein